MNKFSYINHSGLKLKLEETYSYIKFLFNIEKNDYNKNISSSINRDLIIHATSLLEGILSYYILIFYENCGENNLKKFNKIFTRIEYKEIKKFKDLEINNGSEKLFLCTKKENFSKISGNFNFGNLIEIIKKSKLFSKEIIKELEEIQNIRNDLHIQKVLDNKIYLENITDNKLLELFEFIKKIENLIKKECVN